MLHVAPGHIRSTLVTAPHAADKLVQLVQQIGVRAIQLRPVSSPKQVRQLRREFGREALTIIQEVSFRKGRFWKEKQIDEYLDAGADFILVDKLKTTAKAVDPMNATIPSHQIADFRDRHPGLPVFLAGGISAENVRSLLSASGAAGIDVCSSVRQQGTIRPELVALLMERVLQSPATPLRAGRSLRSFLTAVESRNHVIAYLTIGDPPGRFITVANDVLEAGALTLELGLPYAKPNEGSTLTASHRRALDAGVDTATATAMMKTVAHDHPGVPLVAVVQWPAIKDVGVFVELLDQLVDAGASAVLPVGLPYWQLPNFAAHVHAKQLETAIPCAPDCSSKLRAIAYRYCSGCLYVPRGRMTGGSQEFTNFADFCHLVAGETDLPMIGGVGVNHAADVAEICGTPAKAAAVGSALVDHAMRGSAGQFIRRLLSC